MIDERKKNFFFRTGRPSVHALGLAAAAAALLAGAWLLPPGLWTCPIRAATGWPCLTCGCTRAFRFAVRGDFPAALAASPLGTLLACACAVHVLWTALRLFGLPWAPRLVATPRLRLTLAAALLGNWLFLVLK